MFGVTKLDRIRNERIRGVTKVGETSSKVHESLNWCGHVVMRREEPYDAVGDGCWMCREKERKTEVEVDGQHQESLDREEVIR